MTLSGNVLFLFLFTLLLLVSLSLYEIYNLSVTNYIIATLHCNLETLEIGTKIAHPLTL